MPEEIELTPFQYTIRSKEVSDALIDRNFILIDNTNDGYVVQAPDTISATKARNIISTMISLFKSAKEVAKAQDKYNDWLVKLEMLYR